MDAETHVKVTLYRAIAESGKVPTLEELAAKTGRAAAAVRESLARLRAQRLLLFEADGETIRMAPPFSGVPTQHQVIVDGVRYFANCAWDALGIPAALHRSGTVHSRCEESLEPFRLEVGESGPEPSSWLFHCLVPAAQWWDDLVYT